MKVVELLRAVEDFHNKLVEHRNLWNKSLAPYVPSFPVKNKAVLEQQSKELLRILGWLRPLLIRYRKNWIMGVPTTGQKWDALEAAMGLSAVAQIKGPSLRHVIEALNQIIGQLQQMNPDEEIDADKGKEDKQSVIRESSRVFETSEANAVVSSQSSLNRTDRWITGLKNNRVLAIVIVAAILLIAVGQVTDSLNKLGSLIERIWTETPESTDSEGRLSVQLRVKNIGHTSIELSPLCKYYLTEDVGFSIQEYPSGRLQLTVVPLEGYSTELTLHSQDSVALFCEFPNPRLYSSLLDRGAANLHLTLFSATSSRFWLESIPFERKSLELYYIPFEITNENDSNVYFNDSS